MDLIITLVIGFILGYVVSLVHKGITIVYKDPELPTDEKGNPKYNESLAHLLPKEMQEYYKDTDGMNKF